MHIMLLQLLPRLIAYNLLPVFLDIQVAKEAGEKWKSMTDEVRIQI